MPYTRPVRTLASGRDRRHGETYPVKYPGGSLKMLRAFPQVAQAAEWSRQLSRMEQKFGLSPSSRSGLRIDRSSEPCEVEQFIARMPRHQSAA